MNARSELHDRLVSAGWPKAIGLNDKRTSSHLRYSLDGLPVDSYWTSGSKFQLWDSGSKLLTQGVTSEEAAIAMVIARENADSRVYGAEGRGPDGRLRVSQRLESSLKGKPRRIKSSENEHDA